MASVTTAQKRPYLSRGRLLRRQEFKQIADSGVFEPDERLELIAGEIVAKELPTKTAHATSVSLAEIAMRNTFTEGYVVRSQLPLALSEYDEPLPDIAVVLGSVRDYEEEHPTTAILIVETADPTLRMDRTTKASLYARAGIPEYWIVNLNDRLLEVYRHPVPMRGQAFGYGYVSVTHLTETDTVSPLAAPEVALSVADLLPRRRSE